jgi:hypothetical protein
MAVQTLSGPRAGDSQGGLHLPGDYELIVAEQSGERRAFFMRQQAYHTLPRASCEGSLMWVRDNGNQDHIRQLGKFFGA